MVFCSEYWLSNLVRPVNAPSIWKILIKKPILFSNLSCTLRFAMLLETMTYSTYTNTQTFPNVSLYAFFKSSVAPLNYTDQIKNQHTHTHTAILPNTNFSFLYPPLLSLAHAHSLLLSQPLYSVLTKPTR